MHAPCPRVRQRARAGSQRAVVGRAFDKKWHRWEFSRVHQASTCDRARAAHAGGVNIVLHALHQAITCTCSTCLLYTSDAADDM
eukprot:10379435-Alexandrium_andersonii.AAC.1